jgi:hypothetical protein
VGNILALSGVRRRVAATVCSVALATLAVAGVPGLGNPASVSAHCLNSSGTTQASSSGYGEEYNLNGNTCNGDFTYTGRFFDLASDGFRIRMRWKLTSAGAYTYSAITNGVGNLNELVWSYADGDSTAYFNICRTDLNGNLIDCASQGTDIGH